LLFFKLPLARQKTLLHTYFLCLLSAHDNTPSFLERRSLRARIANLHRRNTSRL